MGIKKKYFATDICFQDHVPTDFEHEFDCNFVKMMEPQDYWDSNWVQPVSLLGYVFSPYLLIFLKTEMQMAETTERFIKYSKL